MGMTQPLYFKCKIHTDKEAEDYLPTRMMNGPGYGWGCSICAKNSTIEATKLDTEILY